MKSFMIAAGLVLAGAGLLLAPAPVQAAKKTEAEMLAELKAKVKAKYVEKSGGLLFRDYIYWVDLAKVKDRRWSESAGTLKDASEANVIAFVGSWTPAIDAPPDQQISLFIQRMRHKTTEGGQTSTHSVSFENTGESVSSADAKKMINAMRKNWMATAKDLNEKATVEVTKAKSMGEVDSMTAAEGADGKSGLRQRKEWYSWINGKRGETYTVGVTYGAAVTDKTDKVATFLKNVKLVKEMK